MTYEYTLIYSRPSTDTSFYTAPENVIAYINATWRTDGMYVTEESLSADGFEKIIKITFKDVETWLRFIDDPVIKDSLSERNAYHTEHDITVMRLEG
jgi:hypothetical protein